MKWRGWRWIWFVVLWTAAAFATNQMGIWAIFGVLVLDDLLKTIKAHLEESLGNLKSDLRENRCN